ncbi:MAG: NAD(P)-dependent oxidoreductase [Actinobacteria bacterium]|nr:NAD(P)-dependent oxidoreductase [Actinomycetota bacterium]
MIIVDSALQRRQDAGNPIKVGVIGSGFAGQGFVDQVMAHTPGMTISVVANRTLVGAAQAFEQIGYTDFVKVSNQSELDAAIAAGRPAICDDPALVCENGQIEAVVEATGEIEFGAHNAVGAIDNGKHLILLNAELDCTLGPILKKRADAAGVVFTDADGDQPGVLMNLAREAEMMGFTPVVYGNIKSLLDHRRTPETQAGFAANVFQRPKHITSFADGTKIAAEMACVANATGFGVSERGMEGPECSRVEEAVGLFPAEQLYEAGTGIVDYILGAEPSFGVFVLAHSDSWLHERYMKIYKMGAGPIYTFYRPYHLSPLETPLTVARAVLFNDATITPKGAPVTDVVALAKFDLAAGATLDGVGGFSAYGVMENSPLARRENLLPMGLSDGAVLKRDVAQDTPLTFDDVELPAGRLCDRLWAEQVAAFSR